MKKSESYTEVAPIEGWVAAGFEPVRAGIQVVDLSADGLVRVYVALANNDHIDGVNLLSRDAIGKLLRIQSARQDALLGFEGNWALGLSFNYAGMLGPHPRTFGYSGWGGSFGCANMELRLGVGYVCNRMGDDLVGDPRTCALCEAIFA